MIRNKNILIMQFIKEKVQLIKIIIKYQNVYLKKKFKI